MPSLLLLIPTTSYRTADFIAAAKLLDVDVVVGSDKKQVLEEHAGGATFVVDFNRVNRGVEQVLAYAESQPLEAVLSVDDGASAVAAEAARRLGLKHNPPQAVETARNKYRFRKALSEAGLPTPDFRLLSVTDGPAQVASEMTYPCVLKPLTLAMSRGVIRVDDSDEFIAAFERVCEIIARPDAATPGEAADHIVVESYLPGTEVAIEGLLDDGQLQVLAVFDKPDPLEGPYFEETIYVTPSRLPQQRQHEVAAAVQAAAKAIGLRDGPLHADIRFNADGVWVIEADARSIGGQCSRSLRFGAGMRLEELILRHALDLGIDGIERENAAGGVLMIPIPKAGILQDVSGIEDAKAVAGVEEANVTIPLGHPVLTVPEAGRYLGFVIARGKTPADVEIALRQAHERLDFVIEPAV